MTSLPGSTVTRSDSSYQGGADGLRSIPGHGPITKQFVPGYGPIMPLNRATGEPFGAAVGSRAGAPGLGDEPLFCVNSVKSVSNVKRTNSRIDSNRRRYFYSHATKETYKKAE